MNFSIIVALTENNGIGANNDLLCHVPGDLKRFKEITLGHTVIMGRKTYESLPNGPLPKRRNIIISRNNNLKIEGVEIAQSIKDAIALCENEDECFIIGGGDIYYQFLPFAKRLYLTKIHKSLDADVFFPKINFEDYTLIEKKDIPTGEKNDFSFSFETYERIKK